MPSIASRPMFRVALATIAACGGAAGGPAVAASRGASPTCSATDEATFAEWVAEARLGKLPRVGEVDPRLYEAPAADVRSFYRGLKATAGRAQATVLEKQGLARLLAIVDGFPHRMLEAVSGAGVGENRTQRIDNAFAILTARTSPFDVELATRLATARMADGDSATARSRLQGTFEVILRETGNDGVKALCHGFPAAPAEMTPAFVDALRGELSAARLAVLVGLLGSHPEADGQILNRAQGMALRLGPVLEEVHLTRLRFYLTSSSEFERRGAVQVLGALEDRTSIAPMIELLEDPEPSVRHAAHDALRNISAMTIGAQPSRWRTWLVREQAWWESQGPRRLRAAVTADRAELLEFLRSAAQHRLYRDEITAVVRPMLADADDTVVRIALATLEGLRARGVELDVIALLEHRSGPIRSQAAECLRNLTGRSLPADAKVWRRIYAP